MDKIELLYDHYKETFSRIKESLNDRNHFFVMVFIVMAIQFLFATSADTISYVIITFIKEKYKIDIAAQISIIQSLLWLILLYFTMRYYQINVYIERQYNYIHSLEDNIAIEAQVKFDREGGDYLSNYPKMNDFMDILYKWVFPIIYCLIISYKIIIEYITLKFNLLLLLNTILFISCFVLTILYLIFLHGKRNSDSNRNS